MKKETKEFIKLLLMTQEELFNYVCSEIPVGVKALKAKGNYIYVTTTGEHKHKPLLTSHLDTVDEGRNDRLQPKDLVISNGVLSTKGEGVLGGDDRAGVWIMLQLLRDTDRCYDYDYVFFCDEEVGGIGSSLFGNTHNDLIQDYNCFISLDRRGVDEVATYGYDNQELIDVFVDKGFVEAYGSFTDCVNLSEASNVACVNLSVGYDNEHTNAEIQSIVGMYSTLRVLQDKEIVDKLTTSVYNIETMYSWRNNTEVVQENAIICDCCGDHAPLYQEGRYLLCADCIGVDGADWVYH